MKEAEKAQVLAILKENNNIIKTDGEEFFKNLKEDEPFKYLISDMVKGKAIIEDDDDGGVKIDLPMEQTQDVKIDKKDGLKHNKKHEGQETETADAETISGMAEAGEMGEFGALDRSLSEQEQQAEPENTQTQQARGNVATEPNYVYSQGDTTLAQTAEPAQEAGASDLDSAIEAEMAKMKNEGLIQDNSEIVIEKDENDEYGDSYAYDTPSYTEPAKPEQEEVKEEPAPAPEGESDLDRQIREEMEKMKNEGLVQDNSKIVIDK